MNTPYGKDVLKMLSDACKKHGVLLSLYYSNPDWHHVNGYNPLSSHQWKAVSKEQSDTEKYREYVKNQITELLTNYGDIYTLFWDIPPQYEDKSINELVRKLQPNILINDRGYDKGDFSTPERELPDGARFTRMTEACDSVGEQAWGYRKNEDYHSIRYLTSSIDKVMAMGGNFLLNVGPMSNGKFPEIATDIINRVGQWYKKVEPIIENNEKEKRNIIVNQTTPCIINSKNGKTYLHFYNGVCSSAITMTEFPSVPKKAILVNDGSLLGIRHEKLPAYTAKDGTASGPYLSITNIPCDEFSSEPIVIEIEW
jgi:alpha-L-fucosidase